MLTKTIPTTEVRACTKRAKSRNQKHQRSLLVEQEVHRSDGHREETEQDIAHGEVGDEKVSHVVHGLVRVDDVNVLLGKSAISKMARLKLNFC